MAASTLIRLFMLEAQRRLNAVAVAFTPPSRDFFEYVSTADDPELHATIEGTADTFLLECRRSEQPIVRNKVRFESGGPRIGRFVVVRVNDGADLAGILLIYRRNEDPEFGAEDILEATTLGRVWSAVGERPLERLTGLIERDAFDRIVHWRLPSLERAAVVLGDIDQLHMVNDLWNYSIGDRVITSAAAALESALTPHDALLTRLSGDRFAVFLAGATLERARDIASQLRASISSVAVDADAAYLPLAMSFGAAAVEGGNQGFEHALAQAEAACKAAKQSGRNRVELYRSSDSGIVRRREDISVVSRLRTALDEGRYEIFGQPIASLLTPEDAQRYEMLIRIIDEKGRRVLPADFMSSATRYQLMPYIDRCVLSQVLAKLKAASLRPGWKPLNVAFNLSEATLADPQFLDWIASEIHTSGVRPEWLAFELEHTTTVGNVPHAHAMMRELAGFGCKFSLDHFGACLSSLSHLTTLPFSTLKLDGSFVRDILTNERSRALVQATAQLSQAMGMETVAEFVETPELCMRLIELKVEFGQGYAIGRPRPFDFIVEPGAVLARAG
jgi:diguanylate cyclase (GGDEF)-like protein